MPTLATNFSWNINTLERATETGEIKVVHWTCVADDGTDQASSYGSVSLDPADPENMVPYEDVTEEEVVGWLHDKMGEETVVTVEDELQQKINEQREPSKASGLPW